MELLLRESRDGETELSNMVKRQARVLGSILIKLLDAFPLFGLPFLGLELVILRLSVRLLELIINLGLHDVCLLLRNCAIGDHLLLINSSDRSHLGNLLVHERLSEAGLIELVVTHLTVTNEVDDDVMVELLAVLRSDLEAVVNVLHAVSVDMEDGSADSLGEVRGVHVTATLGGHGGETNLVVHDDVDGATDAVVLQVLHLHGLVDDTLTGESGVTVNEDGHDGIKVTRGTKGLSEMVLSSNTAHDDRIDALKMRGVGENLDGQLLAIVIFSREGSTQVIFDITRGVSLSGSILVGHDTLELGENGSQRLANDVSEHVETTTMRHTNDDLGSTMLHNAIHANLHARNKGLDTLETESLHSVELLRDELSEAISPVEAIEMLNLLLLRHGVLVTQLNLLTNIVALLTVRDVHVLDTDFAAIS